MGSWGSGFRLGVGFGGSSFTGIGIAFTVWLVSCRDRLGVYDDCKD